MKMQGLCCYFYA